MFNTEKLKIQWSPREAEILEKTVAIIERRLAPHKIHLFGSRAKLRNAGGSDFDLAVDIPAPDVRTKRMLMEEIEEIAGLYSVDVVYLGSADDDFKELVLKTAEVIYEKDGD
ncbi:MAG: nucleotidyltransferase domain-containing protein [bacterium]